LDVQFVIKKENSLEDPYIFSRFPFVKVHMHLYSPPPDPFFVALD